MYSLVRASLSNVERVTILNAYISFLILTFDCRVDKFFTSIYKIVKVYNPTGNRYV